jgi:CRISPR/Cas system-associated exonuclease Cas4 (RecB family)
MLGVVPFRVEHVSRCVDQTWHEPFERPDFGSVDKERELRSKAEAMLRLYIETMGDEPPPLQVEASLTAPLVDPRTGEDLGIPLLGIVDLVVNEQAGPCVVDFKTAARSTTPSALAHELQLTAYAYLARHNFSRRESGVEIRRLIKTKQPRVMTHRYPPRTDRQIDGFFDLVREYLDALDRGRFAHRPSWRCDTCEHLSICTSELGC